VHHGVRDFDAGGEAVEHQAVDLAFKYRDQIRKVPQILFGAMDGRGQVAFESARNGENLLSTGFARDYVMHAEMCAKDGKLTGLRVDVIADHGAFDSTAQPTKFPAGFFHICCGSYDLEASHVKVKAVYTNKAPGGVAYRCSFRITEAVYLVERMVDCLADELGVDPAELRLSNLSKPDQFPYQCKTGWEYDPGDYEAAPRKAMERIGYQSLRDEQTSKRQRGELMGIGVGFFTEAVGAGPRKHMDILGLGMNDGAALRVHPTGKAQLGLSVQTQGQGHETIFKQIVCDRLGLNPQDHPVVDQRAVEGPGDSPHPGAHALGEEIVHRVGVFLIDGDAVIGRCCSRQGKVHPATSQ